MFGKLLLGKLLAVMIRPLFFHFVSKLATYEQRDLSRICLGRHFILARFLCVIATFRAAQENYFYDLPCLF